MLAGARDSPSFSDGEDNLAYLSALAVREEERGETSLSPDMYVHPGLQGAKLEAAELEEQESSEYKHSLLVSNLHIRAVKGILKFKINKQE